MDIFLHFVFNYLNMIVFTSAFFLIKLEFALESLQTEVETIVGGV